MSTMNSRILSTIFRYLKTRPSLESVGIEPYRQLLEKSAAAFKPPDSVESRDFMIRHIPARWLTPDRADDTRTIVYVHGGGYIAGSMNSHRDLASRIAIAARSRLLIFNYRLAPEHPFPSGINDVTAVYNWLSEQTGEDHRICLIGDSAGGGLVTALLSLILRNEWTAPACAVLISPWVDLECKNKSHLLNADKDPMLGLDALKKTARLYTGKDLALPLVSPVNNRFKGCCPVLIQAGENEVLLDDARILAGKLEKDNVRVQLEIWDEMFHVWHYFARYLSEGRQAIRKIGDFVQAHT